jgi:hypothetical protein
MAFKTTVDIDSTQLAGELTRINEISDRVRLAGFALAMPLLDLRRAQMQREIDRVAAKKGPEHPDVAARRAALARATARFGLAAEEMSRARLDMPSLKGENTAGLWGRVAENGTAVPGITVVVSSDGKRIDFCCTDANGGYAMEVPANTPLVLSVRSPEGAEIYRDPEAQSLAAGQQQYREIDLGRGAAKPCPEPPPETSAPQRDSFPMVSLVGQKEADAMAILRTQGLTLGKRTEEIAESRAGLVIAQDPRPRTLVKRGDAVSIVVGTSAKATVPSVVGLTREEAAKALREVGLTVGEVTFVPVSGERAGVVTRQNPEAGSTADPGDKVALEIGQGPRTPPSPPRRTRRK